MSVKQYCVDIAYRVPTHYLLIEAASPEEAGLRAEDTDERLAAWEDHELSARCNIMMLDPEQEAW